MPRPRASKSWNTWARSGGTSTSIAASCPGARSAQRKSTTSRAYDLKVRRARSVSCCSVSCGKSALRLSTTAARVRFISRQESHVDASPIAYDSPRGNKRTSRQVALKTSPLFRPCRVQRPGAAAPGKDARASAESDAFEESIVHRQKTGLRGVAHWPELARLTPIDGRDRHARDAAAASPQLDEHLCFDF